MKWFDGVSKSRALNGLRLESALAAWLGGFDVGSAYEADAQKGLGWVSLNLIAKTKKRPDYALAVPLNCGDEGYIFFRRMNANYRGQ